MLDIKNIYRRIISVYSIENKIIININNKNDFAFLFKNRVTEENNQFKTTMLHDLVNYFDKLQGLLPILK